LELEVFLEDLPIRHRPMKSKSLKAVVLLVSEVVLLLVVTIVVVVPVGVVILVGGAKFLPLGAVSDEVGSVTAFKAAPG
jgi:hypothetical protein